ncbi:Aspartic peptidase domain superfamily [Arabidopsis suecica]|uniref:Aspartic peptidase domain superfamily n=1 Tax=Arabidopsis suecica TaxID=45249 RepID=A0A8T1ZVZ4_ARASU|nr:Aspartic peptidase domain superfamily [Arabidopsis suecica]
MNHSPTQAAQSVDSSTIADLEAKLNHLVEKFGERLETLIQNLKEQQDEDRQWEGKIHVKRSYQKQIQEFARRDSYTGSSSGYEGSHSQELSDGFEDGRAIGNDIQRTTPQVASDKWEVRNEAMFWTNSAKAWEQVGWKSHKLSADAAGTSVICIGFQRKASKGTPKNETARELQETPSQRAVGGSVGIQEPLTVGYLKQAIQPSLSLMRTKPYDYQLTQLSLTVVQGDTYDLWDKLAGVKEEYEYRNELEGLKEDLDTMRQGKEQSMTDLTKRKGMRFYGFISGHKIIVLIDSGATNNFMSYRLATQLKLSVADSSTVKVSLSYGLSSNVMGRFQEITLQVNDIQIVESYYLLDLGSMDVDVILGYEWLSKLGETDVNWQDHIFSLIQNHDWITLCAKDKDLEQGTEKVKMRNENVKDAVKSNEGRVVDYYLEDKVVLKGVS